MRIGHSVLSMIKLSTFPNGSYNVFINVSHMLSRTKGGRSSARSFANVERDSFGIHGVKKIDLASTIGTKPIGAREREKRKGTNGQRKTNPEKSGKRREGGREGRREREVNLEKVDSSAYHEPIQESSCT